MYFDIYFTLHLLAFIWYRQHTLGICRCDKVDRLRIHMLLGQDKIVFHNGHLVLQSRLQDAHPNIYTG